MKHAPTGGLVGKILRLFRYAARFKIPVYAAHAGYFMVLSLFPTLVLLLSLLRYTGLSVDTLTSALNGIIPAALLAAAKKLIISTYMSTTGTVVSVSAVTALWSASRGIYGLITGLNAIYNVEEDRGYFYTRSVSVLYTFLFLLVILLTLSLNVFGTTLLSLLVESPLFAFFAQIVDLRFVLLLTIQTLLFSAVFMVLPNRRNTHSNSLPGALLASCGWLGFSHLFSVYVRHFSSYANIYGSVYAVALSMLWLYFCISIVFYGGVLNRYLADCRKMSK